MPADFNESQFRNAIIFPTFLSRASIVKNGHSKKLESASLVREGHSRKSERACLAKESRSRKLECACLIMERHSRKLERACLAREGNSRKFDLASHGSNGHSRKLNLASHGSDGHSRKLDQLSLMVDGWPIILAKHFQNLGYVPNHWLEVFFPKNAFRSSAIYPNKLPDHVIGNLVNFNHKGTKNTKKKVSHKTLCVLRVFVVYPIPRLAASAANNRLRFPATVFVFG